MFVVTRQIVSVKGPWLKCHVFIVPVSRPRASEHRLTSHKLRKLSEVATTRVELELVYFIEGEQYLQIRRA